MGKACCKSCAGGGVCESGCAGEVGQVCGFKTLPHIIAGVDTSGNPVSIELPFDAAICASVRPGTSKERLYRLEQALANASLDLLPTERFVVQQQGGENLFGARYFVAVENAGCYKMTYVTLFDEQGAPIQIGTKRYKYEVNATRVAIDATDKYLNVLDPGPSSTLQAIEGTPGRCPCDSAEVCATPVGTREDGSGGDSGFVVTVYAPTQAELPFLVRQELCWTPKRCICAPRRQGGRQVLNLPPGYNVPLIGTKVLPQAVNIL